MNFHKKNKLISIFMLIILVCGIVIINNILSAGKQGDLNRSISSAKAELIISDTAKEIIGALKNKNMEQLSSFIHPQKGIRFSPYCYVEKDSDVGGISVYSSIIKSISMD